MFSNAIQKANQYTHPLLLNVAEPNGATTFCSAFIVINNEGWIITAAHCLNAPSNVHDYAFWWGRDDIQLVEQYVLLEVDLLIGRIEPFNRKWIKEYPAFQEPSKMRIGTSLCRLGYPFNAIQTKYDTTSKSFDFTYDTHRYPIEGIYTREISEGTIGEVELKCIETSSPGLRGQSGGPIFDKNGYVWGLQSKTRHYHLGFTATANISGKRIEEEQFLNAGIGVHSKTITMFLEQHNVRYNKAKKWFW